MVSQRSSLNVERASGGRVRPGLRSLVATVLVLGVSAGAVSAQRLLGRRTSATAHYTYGGLPSWLPTAVTPTNRVLRASADHPQLAIEGDVVHVVLGSGVSTTVTMTGPQTPPFVTPPPPFTTATITISVRPATGVFEMRAHDFALIDGNGNIYHPATFLGGHRQVRVSQVGGGVVRLREFMAIGSGSIRWAPAGQPMVTWEFTVEND